MSLRPNIILVILDTIRADHLSCYGHSRKTTPNIDKIAKEGVLYENAFSPAPWTPPAHASIFTGKYPSYHRTFGRSISLKKENTTLAEVLKLNGYQTFGLTACDLLGAKYGYNRGFDLYININDIPKLCFRFIKQRSNELIRDLIYGFDSHTFLANEIAKKLLNNRAKCRPFFLFINFFNCHQPYDPPRPFKARFCNDFSESRLYVKEMLLKKISKTTEKLRRNLDINKLNWIARGPGGFSFVLKDLPISEEEWEIVKSWYDGEIAYLDHNIGELVAFLRENDLFDTTLLIITSDHGENFGEHGLAGHPLCLYDSLLHVPLVMRCPAIVPQSKRISEVVSTIDILPTLVDILNLSRFNETVHGRSLSPFEDRKIHDFVCAEYGGLHQDAIDTHLLSRHWSRNVMSISTKLKRIDTECKCIRNDVYKYIRYPDKEEMYNIREDPLEQTDIAGMYPEKTKALRGKLQRFFSNLGTDKALTSENRQKTLEKLKALGYLL